jgi:hypothetical protein
MATRTRPAGRPSIERDRRRPSSSYRPANAPRTTVRATARPTPGTAPASTLPPVAATAVDQGCAACARTRRFERRTPQLLRRILVAAALVGVATLTAPSHPAAPASTGLASTPPTTAVTTRTVLDQQPTPAWQCVLLLPSPDCPPRQPGDANGTPSGAHGGR